MKQKGMTFDYDFGYYFPLFSSLLKKRGKKEKERISKNHDQSHAFLLDHTKLYNTIFGTIQFLFLVVALSPFASFLYCSLPFVTLCRIFCPWL